MAATLIDRYRNLLPVSAATPVVSLGEGSTPLLPLTRLSSSWGVELWAKWEGANPTGSYKDRGMTVAVSKAVEEGVRGLICASTGNTAASAGAYAARAGIRAVVLVPDGAVAGAKVAQTRMVGARVLEVRGSFADAYVAARELVARGAYTLVNSLNPHRLEGQKTAVHEIVEELGSEPDVFAIPYGGGGNTRAYAMAFAELALGSRLVTAQAADRAGTLATAIRITEPAHAPYLPATPAEVVTVTDAQIVDAWRELAREEGLFCEPSSAAGLAAIKAERPDGRIVCTLTGHGLKDLAAAEGHASGRTVVDPDPDAILAAAEAGSG